MKTVLLKTKVLGLLIPILALLASCAVPISTDSKITQSEATEIIKQLAGTEKPARSLYHTYEGTHQLRNYHKKGGSNIYTTKELLTLTKQEGNYVEGRMNRDSDGKISSYPVFGRFNFTHLYIFNADPAAEWPSLTEYRIDQNGRILFETKAATKNLYGVMGNLNWKETKQQGVDLYPLDNKWEGYFTTTGLISKTDDYIGEHGKSNAPASQTLTEKLKELKDLLDQNIISQQEYDAARKKLLKK